MLIETVTLHDNKKMQFLNMGYRQGKTYLAGLGYAITDNAITMQTGNSKAKFNKWVGYWIID